MLVFNARLFRSIDPRSIDPIHRSLRWRFHGSIGVRSIGQIVTDPSSTMAAVNKSSDKQSPRWHANVSLLGDAHAVTTMQASDFIQKLHGSLVKGDKDAVKSLFPQENTSSDSDDAALKMIQVVASLHKPGFYV